MIARISNVTNTLGGAADTIISQQAGTKQGKWGALQSLVLGTWSTSICCTRPRRGRISIPVQMNFNRKE